MCLAAKNFVLQEENINISKPQGKITILRNMGWGTTERERERQTDRKSEKEGGKMQCFMKKEDKSQIDVANVVNTGKMCCHLS